MYRHKFKAQSLPCRYGTFALWGVSIRTGSQAAQPTACGATGFTLEGCQSDLILKTMLQNLTFHIW
jgi:hypothetical protein